MSSLSNKRNSYLDSTKVVLIYLVVLGHCLTALGGVSQYKSGECALIMFNFIYLIHMPLFALVSGYFSNPEKGIAKSCTGIISAFFLFQIIWMIINPPNSLHKLLFPAVTLWYLLSLSFWRLMICFMQKMSEKKKTWLVLSLNMMIIAGFISISREFSFQRTFAFFPFFVMGNMMRGTDIVNMIKRQNKIFPVIVIVAFVCILYYYHPYTQWLLFGVNPYYKYHCALLLAPLVKIVWFLTATIIGFAFWSLIPDAAILASHGSKTLTVYLFHFFPIYLLQKIGSHTDSLFNLIILSLIIFSIAIILHRFRFIRWMTCPIVKK